MLWVEYESSETVNKQVVQDVISKLVDLVSPTPVAAEDYRVCGIGIIASDECGNSASSDSSSGEPDVQEELDVEPLLKRGIVASTDSNAATDADNGSGDTSRHESRTENEGQKQQVDGNQSSGSGGDENLRNNDQGE